MSDISWINTTIKLGSLKPWGGNPRQSTKQTAKKLLQSFETFGQVESVAIGPDNEVYNGHQRLSALMTVHGKDYTVDARRASRALTDEERRQLTLMLHAGATGEWDWDALSAWDAEELREWAFDDSLLITWKRDVAALGNFLGSEKVDYEAEWEGMPEFENEDNGAFRTLKVHFANQNDLDDFSQRMGQMISDKAIFIWHPKQIREDLKQYQVQDES
jgi:hypothetical protein